VVRELRKEELIVQWHCGVIASKQTTGFKGISGYRIWNNSCSKYRETLHIILYEVTH
jgi:hypothetical protein